MIELTIFSHSDNFDTIERLETIAINTKAVTKLQLFTPSHFNGIVQRFHTQAHLYTCCSKFLFCLMFLFTSKILFTETVADC